MGDAGTTSIAPADARGRVPRISPLLWRWFGWYAERALRKSFHAVRVDPTGADPATPGDVPVIIYSNHPSWWDPMVAIFLARRWFPDRRHYWPIDAAMLEKYRFFGKLGFFGVEPGTARGGASFLRTATAALAPPGDACLWIAAEGEFADVRRRPLRLRPGLAHLARRLGRARILPLALEYAFWTERTPEVLVRVGESIEIDGGGAARDVEDWQADLARRLEVNLDALSAPTMGRDPAQFTTLLGGAAGTNWAYDAWRRARAAVSGRRFDPAHMPEPRPAAPGGGRP
ncbi:MAG TPA: lysophospholipid acyltransferase family protein [Tepidisphaeraceae bacterium]|nr:lysophospholipid acyltransferase family protein [Tepidisphaeraceae bacterium]